MPRKSRKTKPPLLFLEPPLGGTRLQNEPEVRAALNPKSFITEEQMHNSRTRNSWVVSQFDHVAAASVRRGRRKYQSATSILDRCTDLSKKTSVCKFPSLTFQRRERDQSHQPKHTLRKKASDSSFLSDSVNQQQESSSLNRTVSHRSVYRQDAHKRVSSSVRVKNAEDSELPACVASTSGHLDPLEVPAVCETGGCVIPAFSPSTPPSTESQPSTPPHNQAPVVLVADTPEKDYGVKVTWRRRRGLMMLLKEGGHL
ncbi:RAD9, HUS1, RAD1-interacting nuclear orphan protein 1 isoform X2 [Lampris incognitus]|uniref:RAD9, HUS1, RAD1-interacting nuclear orphan protein 1 isoform X2 n=1 Tax=Lampris incognitus TaxID=2546036 RepID=UPI0024B53957|nr:RAD9, HUS1, RAD1-interacting nuclear orphan protein 1 isoform X2 [Lampris incognitus]